MTKAEKKNERAAGRVWSEFSDMKQVVAGQTAWALRVCTSLSDVSVKSNDWLVSARMKRTFRVRWMLNSAWLFCFYFQAIRYKNYGLESNKNDELLN